MLLLPRAPALGAGVSNNPAFTAALSAGSNIREAAKDSLLNPPHLPGAITVRALGRFGAWPGASTLTQGAVLSAQNIYFLLATKGGFLKGNSNIIGEVSTALWPPTDGTGGSAEEGIEDIAKTAEIKALKTAPEGSLSTTVTKAVVGAALIRVREHFVGLIYLLELLLSATITVMVRVILEG